MYKNYLTELAIKRAKINSDLISLNCKKEDNKAKGLLISYDKSDLGEIKGVGEETQRILFENGIYTQKDLKEIGMERVEKMGLSFFSKKGIDSFLKG